MRTNLFKPPTIREAFIFLKGALEETTIKKYEQLAVNGLSAFEV